jgi:hypothetical protein
MKRLGSVIFVLCCLPASASAALTPRIVGGTAAGDGTYPAQAEIEFVVGLLTAGHCASDETSGAQVPASAYSVSARLRVVAVATDGTRTLAARRVLVLR